MSALKWLCGAALLLVAGCTSTPPKQVPEVKCAKTYKQCYSTVKTFIERCFPNAKLHANLYTDIPEGEIIMDYIPGAMMIGGVSTIEGAQEMINIRFVGEGSKTRILSKNEPSRKLVAESLSNGSCSAQD